MKHRWLALVGVALVVDTVPACLVAQSERGSAPR